VKPCFLPKAGVNFDQAAAWLMELIIGHFILRNKPHSGKVQKFFPDFSQH
jgi:hypothetical protein